MFLIARSEEQYQLLKKFLTDNHLDGWLIPYFEPRFTEQRWIVSPFAPFVRELVSTDDACFVAEQPDVG